MEIVGRVINNAVVKQLKDDRKVVNFSVAINDYFKPKGREKGTQTTLFVNCSYWLNTTIAERLTKGCVVEMNGRLFLSAYNSIDGEAKASLNAHINTIKVHHSSGKSSSENAVAADAAPSELSAPLDDLPF